MNKIFLAFALFFFSSDKAYACNLKAINTIKNVIDEIDNVYKIRKNILNKIIADKIKHKYLLPEIDLDCWFF